MENEVNDILQTINEGLKSLPEYASQGWNLMVAGTRFDAINNFAIHSLLIVILIVAIAVFNKKAKKHDDNGNVDAQETFIIMMGLTLFVLVIATFFYVMEFSGYMRGMFMPEYQIISELIRSVR